MCWWLEWTHQFLPLISSGSVFILSGETLPFLIWNDESREVWKEGGEASWRKNRNNKWRLLYLVVEKLFVSLHGCFLRGSSWAILMSISACALARGWQTKYWGTSSVIGEAKFHSSCDNYLKRWILALYVQQLNSCSSWTEILLSPFLPLLPHTCSCGHWLHSWAEVGCSQSKPGQTGTRLQSTRPCNEGCMKQVHAEGEQGLCFPVGEGSVGHPENTLLNKKHELHMPPLLGLCWS